MFRRSIPVILAVFFLTQFASPSSQTSGPAMAWNTFLGSAGQNGSFGVAVDAAGNSYVTGESPATWGTPLRPFSGGTDVFVAKLDPDGTLEWSTFLGGSSYDTGFAIAVDPDGNVCVAGFSWTTWGSPVRPFASAYDGFVAKLDSNGGLLWNTFLGGANYDIVYGIAADPNANLYVTGHSFETWGSPVSPFVGGVDIFAAKLDADGTLLWNTFMGSSEGETGKAIAVDTNGNSFVTGYSAATWGSPLIPHAAGLDAFVAKLNTNGALQWNTFLGGSGNDDGRAIGLDAGGNSYVAGYGPSDWGTPLSPLEGTSDAFLAKLGTNGALQWNTFLGGTEADWANGIAVHANGNSYVTGMSRGTWATPVRPYSLLSDAFVALVDTDGALQWNAFLGGDGVDEGFAIAVSAGGDAFVTGTSEATWGSPLLAFLGGVASFVAKVEGEKGFTVSSSPESVTVDAGQSASYAVLVTPVGPTFDSAVTFACTGLPRGCTASFSPTSVTPGSAAAATALTLKTKANSVLLGGAILGGTGPGATAAILLLFALLALMIVFRVPAPIRGKTPRRLLIAAALAFAVIIAVSCGGGDGGSTDNGTPAGTYTVTVNGTSGSLTASTTVTLVVR